MLESMIKANPAWSAKWNRLDFSSSGQDEELLNLADSMIERAIGYHAIPLGLAGPLLIDGQKYLIPMATEEPSVIAAVSFMSHIICREGIITQSSEPVMTTQIFIEKTSENYKELSARFRQAEREIEKELQPLLASMEKRGGGWRGMDTDWLEESRLMVIRVHIDVRDAMGANLLNSAAEYLRPLMERLSGGSVLMAILTNKASGRLTRAKIRLPVSALSRPGFPGSDVARRVVLATGAAGENSDRGVTHNKGIMNGISALALATGNDTRAIEAAAHAHACRNKQYQPLSYFHVDGDFLHGELSIPLPFAVTGGAVSYHPSARWALEMLNHPSATELSRIAAAVGLVQNLAALRALVSEGIQSGHMALHARRLAYQAGFRG